MTTKTTVGRPRSLWQWQREMFPSLRDEFDSLLSRFFRDEESPWHTAPLVASADLCETPQAFEVRMDLPGMNPDDIDIQLQNNVLTVSGQRQEEHRDDGDNKDRTYHRIERRYGQFSRSFVLPSSVMEDEIAAEYHDGVLNITLPKAEEARGRRIQVKSAPGVLEADKGKGGRGK